MKVVLEHADPWAYERVKEYCTSTPATPASRIARTPVSTPGGSKSQEEKIFVTMRVRPLSLKEHALKDQVAWDCRDEHTIVPKGLNQERSCSSYNFDIVFDPSCETQNVYDEGAKDVALSALTGINATIFAYGQTSSGKTFTMRGITENAVKDIFEHIKMEVAQECEDMSWGTFKPLLTDALINHLHPIQLQDALEDVKESAHDEENGKETGNDAEEITVEESQVPPPEDGREE